MKTNYSTIILRYVHDVVTGEFANIGVVLYAPDQRFLEARFATSYERLNAIFLKIDHLHFRALMRYMINRFEELGAEIRDDLHVPPVNALSEIVKKVLPPDDSSLQGSHPGKGESLAGTRRSAARCAGEIQNTFHSGRTTSAGNKGSV
jgi:hypothetical protein